jgi:hypothetical protein
MTIQTKGEVPDTVQWWISGSKAWRIRTYALDHDIHIHSVDGDDIALLEMAKQNTEKHYGDLINVIHTIHLSDATDIHSVDEALRVQDLPPFKEIVADRFVFWKPDDESYRTQSNP